MATEVGVAYLSVVPSAKGFSGKLTSQIGGGMASAGQKGGETYSSGFRGAVRNIAQYTTGYILGNLAINGITKAFGFAKDAIFGFNSTLQNSTIAFTTMLGSGKKAKTFLDQLQAFAKATPFEFQGLVQNAQLMMGMGISAKNVIPYLTALGDSTASVGGDADKLNNTILAFSQISAKGTLSMDNMNQLLQGGVPNALRILAAQFHVSTGKMVKMISTGKVASSKALPLLVQGIEKGTKAIAGLGGMMDKQSATFSGAMSNIGDALQQTIAKAFLPLFDQAASGLQKFASALGSQAFSNAGNAISTGLGKAFDAVQLFYGAFTYKGSSVALGKWEKPIMVAADNARNVFNALAPVVRKVVAAFLTLGPPLQKFGAAMLPVLRDLGQRIMTTVLPGLQQIGNLIATQVIPAFRKFLPVVTPVAKFLLSFFGSALVGLLHGAINVIKGALNVIVGVIKVFTAIFTGDWGKAWEGIKQIAKGALQLLTGAFQIWWNLGVINIFRKGIFFLTKGLWKSLWSGLKSLAGSGMKSIEGGISAGFAAILRLVRSVIVGYLKIWRNLFRDLWSVAVNGWKVLRSAFGGALAAIRSVVYGTLGAVRSFFVGQFSSIYHGVSGWLGALIRMVRGIPGRILGALRGIGSTLYNAGRSLIQGLINGASSLLRSIGSFFVDKLPGWIRGPFKHALGINSPSRVFAGYGENIVEGVIVGVSRRQAHLDAVMRTMVPVPSASVGSFGAAGGAGGAAQVNVYPGPGMDEVAVGMAAARRIAAVSV